MYGKCSPAAAVARIETVMQGVADARTLPVQILTVDEILDGPAVRKILFMTEAAFVESQMKPHFDRELVGTGAEWTQAVDTMLEVVPEGALASVSDIQESCEGLWEYGSRTSCADVAKSPATITLTILLHMQVQISGSASHSTLKLLT
jgi:hypothetical protein